MEAEELEVLAKYPFLTRSREYVGSLNLSFEDIVKHPIYSASLDMGRKRVIDCIDKSFKPETGDRLTSELTILSYPVARMLAHSIGKAAALKYAAGEAEASYKLLKNEDGKVVGEISEDLDLKRGEGMMPLIEYTKYAAGLSRSNPKWKLVNRVVDHGKVEVGEGDMRALLREAIKYRVMESPDLNRIPEDVKKVAKNLKSVLSGSTERFEIEYLEDNALPPCMKGMISAMENGVASHQGMFILATFLNNLGLKKEDILGVFARSPKYDEEKAAYQLEFVTGEKGGTEYTCPTCATIKSYGLCKADCPVKHPLQYYRQHARRKPKVKKRKRK
ncbi:MAG: hypothetical protein GF416_00480 [Candidatus Altiarchaeales archaeon]|nr:hypothetical protein [Candidatus Altiarchaeales archaeon]MBD3415594.1 hypothetical protein [Candidatus Altiarchaeales archaeon]